MKKFITHLLLIAVLLVPFLTVGVAPPLPADAATFRPNRIIDDAYFDNPNTMSPNDINNFLNSFPYSCISPNSGFQTRVPTGYSPSAGYSYGDYYSAGDAIYWAGQAYGINPQVLLTTLEKEQSLVSGRWSSSYCSPGDDNNHKYASAVGYGCPDSGTRYNYSGLELYRRNGVIQSNVGPTCVNSASKAGFSQQLIRGAWLLKFGEQRAKGNIGWAVIQGSWNNSDDLQACYGGPMMQGTFKRCPNGAAAYYDGYTTIDGTAVHIDSGATGALYWYTPHFHGNQSFVNIFTDTFHFGKTTLGCTNNETPMPQVVSMYNPRTYDHFYTSYACEAEIVGYEGGYGYEGAIFNTSSSQLPGTQAVYRLYNPSTGIHFWSADQNEINIIQQQAGYRLEGLAFHMAPWGASGTHPVYRLYNPRTFMHIWAPTPGNATTQQAGFHMEGVAFYSQ